MSEVVSSIARMTTSTSTRSIDFVSLVAQLSADVSVLASESAGGAWSQVPVVAMADLTAELVSMITAQRVYQANAQTIKTQDQVLQTLVNLR